MQTANKPLLNIATQCNLSTVSQVPVWFMRQAGRYLPEYIELKSKVQSNGGNFLTMCYDPIVASEITLQPLRRFAFDAAILFSDILVVLDAMQYKVVFDANLGISLPQLNANTLATMIPLSGDNAKINAVCQTIKLTKSQTSQQTTMIGFAGSPFTVLLYALLGCKVAGNEQKALELLRLHDAILQSAIELLINNTVFYLSAQIEAGAEVVQLFESHAGLVSFDSALFNSFVVEPNRQIISAIKQRYPHIPVILFPRKVSNDQYLVCAAIGCDVLGLDEDVDLHFAATVLQHKVALQGNLNNELLANGTPEQITSAVQNIVNIIGKNNRLIFNLGHGILPHTPLNNVQTALDAIKNN